MNLLLRSVCICHNSCFWTVFTLLPVFAGKTFSLIKPSSSKLMCLLSRASLDFNSEITITLLLKTLFLASHKHFATFIATTFDQVIFSYSNQPCYSKCSGSVNYTLTIHTFCNCTNHWFLRSFYRHRHRPSCCQNDDVWYIKWFKSPSKKTNFWAHSFERQYLSRWLSLRQQIWLIALLWLLLYTSREFNRTPYIIN